MIQPKTQLSRQLQQTRLLPSVQAICLYVTTYFMIGGSLLPQPIHAAKQAPEFDVRVIVDISGSMKKSDPHNLRAPAMRLLADLLPKDAHAGVWTFGKYVNMLVPYGPVRNSWRADAKESSEAIRSIALWTNIPDALEAATQGWKADSTDTQRALILLTDGVVDISKDPSDNAEARDHVLTNLLPTLKSLSVQVHTIAMSHDVDQALLEELAIHTQGSYSKAYKQGDLLPIFARVFDKAVPQQQIPIEGNRFQVDAGVSEFTALIFRQKLSPDAQRTPLRLIDPQHKTYDSNSLSIKWVSEKTFDLITLENPPPGEWILEGDLGNSSRVTVVSDLKLHVDGFPHQLFENDILDTELYFTDQDQTINKTDFLSILDINLKQVHLDSDQTWETVITSHTNNNIQLPKDGHYIKIIDHTLTPGDHEFTIQVDGKTFKRQFKHHLKVLPAPTQSEEQSPMDNSGLDAMLEQSEQQSEQQPEEQPEEPSIEETIEELIEANDSNYLFEDEPTNQTESSASESAEEQADSPEETPTPFWLYLVIGFVINALIGVIGFLLYRRACKKSQQEMDGRHQSAGVSSKDSKKTLDEDLDLSVN